MNISAPVPTARVPIPSPSQFWIHKNSNNKKSKSGNKKFGVHFDTTSSNEQLETSVEKEMISRKSILLQAQKSMNDYDVRSSTSDEDEDLWFDKDKFFKDHIHEILEKWEQIDDEIWGKIIYMERNRRIAKAYARAPVLTINGSEEGFDGYKIGLNGFETSVNDSMVKRVKKHIGQGVRIKIDETGNVIVKRLSNCDVFIGGWNGDSKSASKDTHDLTTELEYNKSVKLFDMKKFQTEVNKELRSAYPDRRKLENQCVCVVAFVKDAPNTLEIPVWCLVINIVALDMLKSKLPPTFKMDSFIKSAPMLRQESKEDPYSSLTTVISKKVSDNGGRPVVIQQTPPALPPRDLKVTKNKKNLFSVIKMSKEETEKENKKNAKYYYNSDKSYDPYYYGVQARVCDNSAFYRKHFLYPKSSAELRKSQSNGYLNSIFNYPPKNAFYAPYDSAFESDPYSISSPESDFTGNRFMY